LRAYSRSGARWAFSGLSQQGQDHRLWSWVVVGSGHRDGVADPVAVQPGIAADGLRPPLNSSIVSRMTDDDRYPVGPKIRAATVRVIAADGTQLGVLTIEEALRRATDAGLDLVEINPRANPPVCKIMKVAQFKRSLPVKPLSN
jgi:hypothetical protein